MLVPITTDLISSITLGHRPNIHMPILYQIDMYLDTNRSQGHGKGKGKDTDTNTEVGNGAENSVEWGKKLSGLM